MRQRTVRIEIANLFLELLRKHLPVLLVIDRLVDTKLLLQPLALLLPSGDRDDAAAVKLRELASEGSDSTGGTGNDDSLAGLDLGDVEETPVGRLP